MDDFLWLGDNIKTIEPSPSGAMNEGERPVLLPLTQPQKRAIGLDVGTYSVKAIVLESKADPMGIKALAVSPILDPGEMREPNDSEINQAITDCLAQLSGKESYAVTGLSGHDVVVRSFAFPNLTDKEIPGAVQLEALQVCPFDIQKSFLDYQLLSQPTTTGPDNPVQGILAAATQTSVQKRQRAIQKAGARCGLIDVEGLALLNAVQTLAQPSSGTVAVVHIGYQHGIVAIHPTTGLPFVRDIGFAGRLMVDMMAQRTGQSPQEIAHILRHEPKRLPASLNDSFAEAVEHLASEVRETLHYYAVQQSKAPVQRIHLTGGFSQTAGLVEQLNQGLGRYQALAWNPFEGLETDEGPLNPTQLAMGPDFAVALGLALRTL